MLRGPMRWTPSPFRRSTRPAGGGDVLAVSVVCFIHRSVPHDPDARRRGPSRQPAKEAELQVITEVADVPILHLITIAGHTDPFQPDRRAGSEDVRAR
jgi:hypothetical protein